MKEKTFLHLKFFEWISLAINSVVSYCLIFGYDNISSPWILLGVLIAVQGLFKAARMKQLKDYSIIGLLIDGICILILSAICIFNVAFNTSSLMLTIIMSSVVVIEIIVYLVIVFRNKT